MLQISYQIKTALGLTLQEAIVFSIIHQSCEAGDDYKIGEDLTRWFDGADLTDTFSALVNHGHIRKIKKDVYRSTRHARTLINRVLEEQTKAQNPSPKVAVKARKSRTLEDEISEDFKKWWDAYPRKVSKREAWNRYKTIVKNKEMSEGDLLLAAKMYAYECEKKHTEEDFIKHPATFLSAKDRYFEEYLEMYRRIKSKTKKAPSAPSANGDYPAYNSGRLLTSDGGQISHFRITANDIVIPILVNGVESSEHYTAHNGIFQTPDGFVWYRSPSFGKTIKARSVEEAKAIADQY